MYQPPERIRHRLPEFRAPEAAEVAGSRLMSPLVLESGLTLAQRTWVPAMVPWRASAEGEVNDDVIAWYARFAAGRPGVLVIEATGIRDVPSGPLLRIGHDRYIGGLRKVVEAVREASEGTTRVFIQLIDFLQIRRRPKRERYFGEYLTISASHRQRLLERRLIGAVDCAETDVRSALCQLVDSDLAQVLSRRELDDLQYGARERVWDMQLPHVRSLPKVLPELFAAAAGRAKKAGFDGVELHYAHAYTMSSFLSALNSRDDGYGKTLKGRLKLPLEVLRAVRAEVGQGYSVGCRMLCDEVVAGGSGVQDATHFALAFARAGMDFLSLSTGGKFEDAQQPRVGETAYPYTGESGWECMPTTIADQRGPFGRNVPKQAQIRAALRQDGLSTPVVICGGINDFEQAERYLAAGAGDIIGAARQTLADPDWFRKLALGRAGEINRCRYRNYCEALDQRHRQVTCQLWDRSEMDEVGLRTSADGRRRLVAPPWRPE